MASLVVQFSVNRIGYLSRLENPSQLPSRLHFQRSGLIPGQKRVFHLVIYSMVDVLRWWSLRVVVVGNRCWGQKFDKSGGDDPKPKLFCWARPNSVSSRAHEYGVWFARTVLLISSSKTTHETFPKNERKLKLVTEPNQHIHKLKDNPRDRAIEKVSIATTTHNERGDQQLALSFIHPLSGTGPHENSSLFRLGGEATMDPMLFQTRQVD